MDGFRLSASALFYDFTCYLLKVILIFTLCVGLIHHLGTNVGENLIISVGSAAAPEGHPTVHFSGFIGQITAGSTDRRKSEPNWLAKLRARIAAERAKMAARAARASGFFSQASEATAIPHRPRNIAPRHAARNVHHAPHNAIDKPARKRASQSIERGIASYYGRRWNGRKTANGEIFDCEKFTAAHKTLPFGTYVRVVRKDTGRSVVVRINDRGPFKNGRIIDLSSGAARHLDMLDEGLVVVELYRATVADFLQQFMD